MISSLGPIVVNGRFLQQQMTGVQRFASQLLMSLLKIRDDITVLLPPGAEAMTDNRFLRIGRSHGHVWEQRDLPEALCRGGRPLLLGLTNTGPLAYANQVVTHHDLAYRRVPESYNRRFRTAYRLMSPHLLRRSRAVITVSEFSRQEISSVYGVPLSRLTVVPNAVDERFSPGPSVDGRDGCYFLAVSSPARHKNLGTLVRAFASLADTSLSSLRIVGSADPRSLVLGTMEAVPGVSWLGRLTDEQLIDEYRGARAFVFPSLYEGFGIPPLEAQACGCPVIASQVAALPEVLGDSVRYVDPSSIEDLTSAMQQLDSDAQYRAQLRDRGLQNVQRFSWERSARIVSSLLDGLR